MQELTRLEALRMYARMCNRLDPEEIIPHLAEDVHYSSQVVLAMMTTKTELAHYFRGKMETFRSDPNLKVYAEMGETQPYAMAPNPPAPCVLLAQGEPDNVGEVVLISMEGGMIKELNLCTVAPHPSTCKRLGEYPGKESAQTL